MISFTVVENNVQGTISEDIFAVDLTEDTITAALTEDTVDVYIAEGYTVGAGKVYFWEYADETERLAATGFGASQVGYVAKQADDDSLWMLTGYSPISWKPWGVGDMLKSDYDVDDDDIVDEAESIDGGNF